MPDIVAESSIDLEGTLETVDRNRGLIHGIKARMVSPALEIFGMEMPRLARRAARESGTRLMVHIGDTEKRYDANVIRELLPLLDDGDILTHYFTANPGGVLDANGKLVPEGARGGQSRRLARHRPRAHELSASTWAGGSSTRACCRTASAPTSRCRAAASPCTA